MEACVVVCRTSKPKARKNEILLFNAVNQVTRERAQSFLTDDPIECIVEVSPADREALADAAELVERGTCCLRDWFGSCPFNDIHDE